MTKISSHSVNPLPILLVLGLMMMSEAFAQVSTRLSTRFLARGEYARLEIITDGRGADYPPPAPIIPNVRIEAGRQGMIAPLSNNEGPRFAYEFIISSEQVGRHVIPPVTMIVSGQRLQSPATEFWVFDSDAIKLSEVETGGRMMKYYAAFHTAKPQAFEGEAVPAEIKIYVPRQMARFIADWGVPEFERDGVTSWRFEPNDRSDFGEVYLLGQAYTALGYPSIVAPSKTGKVGIGPASLRLTTEGISNEAGFPQRVYQEVFLNVPKLEFESLPLPEGAPAGFENAIGQFTIEANIPKTEITEGESIAVNLTVRGSGNLDSLRAPKLSDEAGWKAYAPISIPRGDERRQLSGIASFHQGILPLEMKAMVPAFKLVYFDPDEKAYKTATTEPVQLVMLPSTVAPGAAAGPPPALAMPIERMNDILAIITPAQLTLPAGTPLPGWLGHAFGALAALILIAKAVWMKIGSRFKKDPIREERAKDLQQLSRIPAKDDGAFLKSAGAFVERWHGANPDAQLHGILDERDRLCFRRDTPAEPLPRGRRGEILAILRKVSLIALFFLAPAFLSSRAEAASPAQEAQEAYNSAKYADAIAAWQSAGKHKDLSADVLYNIGNASYRLGTPGHAALYYRRALVKDPTHAEARQNLRFIERKHGSITVQYSNYQDALAKLPLDLWKGVLWSGLWLTVLSILVFPATRSGARIRVAAAVMLVLGPLLASAGALGWRYYPNDSIFAPVERQAVFVVPKAVLHNDAARTAPEVIDAPEGSLCEIIRISGKWAYVSFASKTRGWVPISSIEKIIPDQEPGVPKVTPPPADDSNA